MRILVLFLCAVGGSACGFAETSGLRVNVHLTRQGKTYTVLPGAVSTVNNAFVHPDLQQPIPNLSGNDKSLIENLRDFAAKTGNNDLCYWTFQALPPPRGGPSALHPKRGYWDVSDGHADQDIEWVQAYGEIAVSRLHSRIEKGGPVVGAMCSMGAHLARRRCENGKSAPWKCVPAVTNATIQWPMAVSIWKVGHPDLADAVQDWRASRTTGHYQNIDWVTHIPGTEAARPWSGPMPKPGELNPSSMPSGPTFPASQLPGWGSPKIAKVVQCADIPPQFVYNTEDLFYCEHLNATGPPGDAPASSVDIAYAAWKSLTGVWPPTKPCEDNLLALDQVLQKVAPPLAGANCSVAFPALQQLLPNFDCDNSDTTPTIRDMCCSVCGGRPIPDVPAPPVPPPAPTPALYQCSVCNHVYDPVADGGGKSFEDLPDSWVCPHCGAPKAAFAQQASGEWAHLH